ncbi:MAG: endonuclease III domain-containing protein, partial [Candidatus Omnitrophica bacterium]|nr:endonuclease III domain-containing protein [Candidatus Omnitrophota bacterium]
MRLSDMYQALYDYFGPQHWWPGDTALEVMVGAILTQNTNWRNVEKAIAVLKDKDVLDAKKLDALPRVQLARYIKPAGYYTVKAARLKNFISFWLKT